GGVLLALWGRAVRTVPGCGGGVGVGAGDRGDERSGVRAHGGNLLEARRGDRALLRRDLGGSLLCEQAHRGDHRRLARGAAVHRMEGLGLHGQGRLRPVLRRAVPAGAEPHGDRGMKDYPRIVVAPPGPKAREIVARPDRWASTSYPKEYPLVIARGDRAMVEDVDGNRYLEIGRASCRGREEESA